MKIETLSINKIKPYSKNAKKHPDEQIRQIMRSIEEFGNNDPIAIDENNVIVEGHGRFEALKRLGYTDIEVIKLTHLSEEQKKAYILAHNQLTMNSGFDLDILDEELNEILTIDMEDFGFELFSVDDIEEQDGYNEESDDRECFTKTFTFPIANKKKIISYLKKHQNEIVEKIIEESLND